MDDMHEMHPPAELAGSPTSRRSLVGRLTAAAAGAVVGAALLQPEEADAATGAMQYGAVNNAGSTSTELWAYRPVDATFQPKNHEIGSGYAVLAEGDILYGGTARNIGISVSGPTMGGLFTSQNGDGVRGISFTGRGVIGHGESFVGVHGYSDYGIGVRADGGRASLLLDSLDPTAPPERTDAHVVGEVVSRDGTYWVCVADGSPGTWRVIAAPGAAGALAPVEPTRVFDSRWPSTAVAGTGEIFRGENRTIGLAFGRALATGAQGAALVPPQATAVQFTLTVTATTGAGFLSVTSAAATAFSASAINWSGEAQSIANSTMCRLTSPELKVWCGGSGGTHFVVDVLGYYL